MVNTSEYILNCTPSENPELDWSLEDALSSGIVEASDKVPASIDLRQDWWPVDDQGRTGACVGFATAYGVLRWHYVKKKLLRKRQKPSARFIWMANKETDNITRYPTTFLETSGTQTKLALRVAQKYGCVPERILPIKGKRCMMSQRAFYSLAARLRISTYHNIGTKIEDWRLWLANQGPILTRLAVDQNWMQLGSDGHLKNYDHNRLFGGHAVCLVGYTPDYFIVRNSWGKGWGNKGFAFASNAYAKAAFTEAYGAVI